MNLAVDWNLAEEFEPSPERVLAGSLELFSARLRHDLLGTLNRVSALTDLLLRTTAKDGRDAGSEELRHLISQEIRKADALSRAIDRFLRAAASPLQMEPVEISEMVRSAVDLLAKSIEDAEADVAIQVKGHVLADRVFITTALVCLVENSVQFRDPGVPLRIDIVAEQRDRQTLLAVRDNGLGIEPERSAKLFEPFQRGTGGGAGLGLATASLIVRRHLGRMWMEPQALGTCIRFSVPCSG